MTRQLESHPLFQRLVAEGVIYKRTFVGMVSPVRLEAYQKARAEEAIILLRRWHLDEHRDLGGAYGGDDTARKRLLRDAQERGANPKEIEAAIEALREGLVDRKTRGMVSLDTPGVSEPVARASSCELPLDLQEFIGAFCRDYHVSLVQFHKFFLQSQEEASDEDVAFELACPVAMVRAVQAVINEWYGASGGEEASGASSASVVATGCVAVIQTRNGHSSLYVNDRRETYAVKGPIQRVISREEQKQWPEVERLWRALNERNDVRTRAIQAICRRQWAFLLSGKEEDLAPLSQADIAREVGCGRDRVHRLLFNDTRKDVTRGHRRKSDITDESDSFLRWVRTPHGEVMLRDLLRELDQIVPRIARQHPQWSDERIRRHLKERFGVSRTRAAIQAARNRGTANEVQHSLLDKEDNGAGS